MTDHFWYGFAIGIFIAPIARIPLWHIYPKFGPPEWMKAAWRTVRRAAWRTVRR